MKKNVEKDETNVWKDGLSQIESRDVRAFSYSVKVTGSDAVPLSDRLLRCHLSV